MTQTVQQEQQVQRSLIQDYLQLMKPALSIMVVFASVISYLLAPNVLFDWWMITLLFIGGMLITGSANAINQVLEKDTDAMMKRTATRPVASGRMTAAHGWGFAIVTGLAGVILLAVFFNVLSALLGAFSLVLYAFVYTPMKKKSAISVFVGAFPGALPCLIGWVAGTNAFYPWEEVVVAGQTASNLGGWVLFGLQFLWQFPHFWAIAWVAHRDYSKAGFKLLPNETGPTRYTALQSVVYALLLIPIGILPYYIDMSGITSLWIVLAANLFMVVQCIRLYLSMDVKAARRVMFSSYLHLPVVLLALLLDKVQL